VTLGTVALAAGDRVTLNLNGNSLVSLVVDRGALDALASNRQLIVADGGEILLSAKAVDALIRPVVNNSGILQANSISSGDGVIRLEGGHRPQLDPRRRFRSARRAPHRKQPRNRGQ
jgi:large exoprotein involved in heme utilization and adhesion